MKQTYLSSHERKQRIVSFVLAGLASVLLITGFATPQIVQLAEFQSRGEFVSRLAKEQETLATYRQQNDLKTLKAGLMLSEVEAYVTELSKLKSDIDAKGKDALSASELIKTIDETEQPLETYAELSKAPIVVKALERIQTITEPSTELERRATYLDSVSWFTAEESELGELFNIVPTSPAALPHDLDKMTNAQFSEVKLQLNQVKQEQADELELQEELDGILLEIMGATDSPRIVLQGLSDEIAEWLNSLEETAFAFDYNLGEASESLGEVRSLLDATAFTVKENGEIMPAQPNSGAPSVTAGEVGETKKGMMLSSLLRVLIEQTAVAEVEIGELEEEQLRLEELERILEEQRLLELQQQQQAPSAPEEPDEIADPPTTVPEEPEEELEPSAPEEESPEVSPDVPEALRQSNADLLIVGRVLA